MTCDHPAKGALWHKPFGNNSRQTVPDASVWFLSRSDATASPSSARPDFVKLAGQAACVSLNLPNLEPWSSLEHSFTTRNLDRSCSHRDLHGSSCLLPPASLATSVQRRPACRNLFYPISWFQDIALANHLRGSATQKHARAFIHCAHNPHWP